MNQDNNKYDTIIFEENPYASGQILGESQAPFMVRLFLKTHIFKNERQVGFFLLGLTIFFFLTSVVVAKFYAFPSQPPSVPLEDLSFIEQTQLNPILLEGLQSVRKR